MAEQRVASDTRETHIGRFKASIPDKGGLREIGRGEIEIRQPYGVEIVE